MTLEPVGVAFTYALPSQEAMGARREAKPISEITARRATKQMRFLAATRRDGVIRLRRMRKSKSGRLLACACLAAATVLALAPAHAQLAPGEVSARASITGYTQFNTTLDSGGRFNWAGGLASASATRQLSPQFSLGVVARYEFQSWNWHEPTAFGNLAAWKNLNAPSVGLDLGYAYAPDLLLSLRPIVAWDFESGANTGDALTWGAVASAAKVYSKDLVLGLGVGAFRRIDKTQVLPFLVVNWRISDTWRIANPFQAGPAGGAGLEAVYSPNERREYALGLSYRSYRFRLATDNATPSGIGENSFIPIFLRVTERLSKDARLDFYGALATYGNASVDYQNGGGRYNDDYNIGPALGVTLVLDF